MSGPLQLPVQLATAAGWALSEYRTLTLTSGKAAGGSAVAVGPQLAGDELWLIDHAVCQLSVGSGSLLRLYESSQAPGFLLDGTDAGDFNVADWPSGLQLQPTRSLVAVWSPAADGAVGTLSLQLRILRRA